MEIDNGGNTRGEELNTEGKTRKLERLNNETRASLKRCIDWLDFHVLNHKIRARCKTIDNDSKRTHARKLNQIGLNNYHKLDLSKEAMNLSNVTLSMEQIETLILGLDYALSPAKNHREKYLLAFEKLAQVLKHQSLRKGGKTFQDVCSSIAYFANETYFTKTPKKIQFLFLKRAQFPSNHNTS